MLGTQDVDTKTVPHGADISGTRFAKEARKLIALITDLRALGCVQSGHVNTRTLLTFFALAVPKPTSTFQGLL